MSAMLTDLLKVSIL